MKIVKVQISSGRSFQGIKAGVTQLKPSDPCDPSWGGGVVASLNYAPEFNSIAVRKDCKFRHIDGKMPEFDVLLIPFALVEAIAMADEAVEEPSPSKDEADPPPAQPIAKQNQGQQNRGR
jgi:hypothetical protein